MWYFGAYMLIFQFRQKYLVVSFTPDSTSCRKIYKGVFFFFNMWLVISCVYGGNSQLKLDIFSNILRTERLNSLVAVFMQFKQMDSALFKATGHCSPQKTY